MKDWKENIIVLKRLRLIIKTSLDSFFIGLKQLVALVTPSVAKKMLNKLKQQLYWNKNNNDNVLLVSVLVGPIPYKLELFIAGA